MAVKLLRRGWRVPAAADCGVATPHDGAGSRATAGRRPRDDAASPPPPGGDQESRWRASSTDGDGDGRWKDVVIAGIGSMWNVSPPSSATSLLYRRSHNRHSRFVSSDIKQYRASM